MAAEIPSEPQDTAATHKVWARTTLWVLIVLILTAGAVFIFRSLIYWPSDTVQKVGQAIEKSSETLARVAAAFNQGTITTSFLSYATGLSDHQRLQFATLKQTEVFTRTDQKTTGFGYLPLPDVVVEARAPVECTYYLDLNAPWRLELKDGVIHVFAPPIQFNKPAVDASEIQYEVRKDSLFRNTTEAQEDLKKSITFMSQQRAKENVKLVRETGRRQTTEFVERWLAKSFADGDRHPVKVHFPDEPDVEDVSSKLKVQSSK